MTGNDEPQAQPLLPEQRVGVAMRAAREVSGLSLRQMARRLGYNSHSMLSEYEKGARMPAESVVEGYERILGLTPGTLLSVLESANIERHGDPFMRRRVHLPTQFVPAEPDVQAAARDELPASRRRRRLSLLLVGVFALLLLSALFVVWVEVGHGTGDRLPNGQIAPRCGDVGYQDANTPDPVWYEPFSAAYQRYGGRDKLGCPRDDDSSGYIHQWGPGVSQDLKGKGGHKARIMALDPHKVIVMSGAYWDDYTGTSGKNSGPALGYPTTDPIECNGIRLVLLEGGEQSPGAMVTGASGRFIWIPKLIWSRYKTLDGPFGRLGRPFGQVEQTPSETRQTFEHGYIRVVAGATKTDLEDRGGQESVSVGKLDTCLK